MPGPAGEDVSVLKLCEDLNFHGTDYIISVSVADGQTLVVDVEQKEDGARWRGEFTSSYIEGVTHQTGNFKKFGVFVDMLCSSLKTSESVYADLLTYSDLEMLRSRQSRKATTSAPAVSKPNNKRYLILTYHVEYDRVHYPLPLTHVEDPPSKALKETIKRLRSELDVARSSGTSTLRASGGDADELRRQIADLKVQLRRVGQRDGGGPSTDEFDAVVRERDDARRDADAHRAKAAQLARENDRLDAELQRDRAQHEDRGEREAHARAMREARRNLTELENDLANEREEARQEQAELRHQIVALTRQNDAAQQQILDLKGQVIDLKQDVEVAKRRSRIEADCSTDPRLESRRQIYGSSPSSRPGSRPASAERRRPSPQPSRPFQRFDPTAYVKDKQASVRGRSVSPRPGVPNPSSRPASAPSSRGSSRPSSAERGGGRPAWGSNSAGGRSPASNVSGGAAGGRDVRPFSRERDRPWAQPPMSIQERRAQAEQARRRPASAERARPGGWGGDSVLPQRRGGGRGAARRSGPVRGGAGGRGWRQWRRGGQGARCRGPLCRRGLGGVQGRRGGMGRGRGRRRGGLGAALGCRLGATARGSTGGRGAGGWRRARARGRRIVGRRGGGTRERARTSRTSTRGSMHCRTSSEPQRKRPRQRQPRGACVREGRGIHPAEWSYSARKE